MNDNILKLVKVILMPLVVALVGVFGTKTITKSQIKSSEKISATELTSQEKRSRDEKQLKLLEIFSDKITSKDLNERLLAVKLLNLIDPGLSTQLASIVAGDSTQSKDVRTIAESVIKNVSKQNSFVIVKSTTDLQEAISFAYKIRRDLSNFAVEVYLAENGNYAITIGAYLAYEEANNILKIVKENPSFTDSYIKQSQLMGDNLLK